LTSFCATDRADGIGAGARRCEGVALIATLLLLLILSAIGLGLILITSLEPLAAANYECAWRARYGAEAGVAMAVHDLIVENAWDAALAGLWNGVHLTALPAEITLPDGTRVGAAALTNLANCGHEAACTEAELASFTTERPWGPNNPRWQPVGFVSLDGLDPGPPGVPVVVVVVWVGDDPAELDGDPMRDTEPAADGTRAPGACVVAVRAEGFSARGAHRTVTAAVGRPGPGCWPAGRLLSWRATP
jgi:hypothetical protein